MTEFVDVPGGRIAYDVTGSGPLVVVSHGIGDRRQAYRFLAPMLAQAGYRVASADLRGRGESSMGWASITRTDVAGDLLALIGHLGGPAVIAGHSISGRGRHHRRSDATGPGRRDRRDQPLHPEGASYSLGGLLGVRRYRRGISLMTAAGTGLADAALTGKGPGAPRPAPTWRRPGGSLWSASRREPSGVPRDRRPRPVPLRQRQGLGMLRARVRAHRHPARTAPPGGYRDHPGGGPAPVVCRRRGRVRAG